MTAVKCIIIFNIDGAVTKYNKIVLIKRLPTLFSTKHAILTECLLSNNYFIYFLFLLIK